MSAVRSLVRAAFCARRSGETMVRGAYLVSSCGAACAVVGDDAVCVNRTQCRIC
jgi:hypothetical protein